MRKKIKIFWLGLMLLNFANLFSETPNVKDVIPAKVFDDVIKNGNYKLVHESGDNDFVLLPDCEFKKNCEIDRVVKKDKNFPFVVEMIFSVKKSDLSQTRKIEISEVSKIFRSVSKMQGMQYFSTTRKKRMTLYKKAYTIESLENPVATKDDTSGSSDGKVLYALLEDASFGPAKYKLAYHESENTLYARFANSDTMGMGLIKAIYPNDLIINVIVIDCGDSFVFYSGTDVDCVRFPGIKTFLEDSFISRLDAIYDWFIKQF